MSKRNPGGLITNTGLREPSAIDQSQNSGVWSLDEQYKSKSNGTWVNQSGQAYEISGSLRFRASATAYLSRTPSVATNEKTCTYSFWMKRGSLTTGQWLFTGGTPVTLVGFNGSSDLLSVLGSDISGEGNITTAVFRDPAAWYHVVIAINTTESSAAHRAKIYVNGVQQAVSTSAGGIVLNSTWGFNTTGSLTIGRYSPVPGSYFDGYLAEINFISGQALDPSYFGYTDYNGVWQPKKYIGGYGVNGFYLPLTSGSSYSYYTPESASVSAAANAGFSFTGDFTLEGWMYGLTTGDRSMFVMYNGSTYFSLNVQVNNGYDIYTNSGGATLQIRSHAPSLREWTHIAMVRSGGVIRVYTNGVASATTLSNSSTLGYTNQLFYIGGFGTNSSGSQNAFFSNVRVSNVARYTSTFDTNAVKVLNSDANTVLLTAKGSTFADVGPNNLTISAVGASNIQRFSHISSTPGQDESGNNNDYTLNNFSFVEGVNQDGMRDSPTNGSTIEDTGLGGQVSSNYATWNAIHTTYDPPDGRGSYSNANLVVTKVAGQSTTNVNATIAFNTGKWYWEVTVGNSSTVVLGTSSPGSYSGLNTWRNSVGGNLTGTASSAYGFAFVSGNTNTQTIASNDIIGISFDVEGGTSSFYKNGTFAFTISINGSVSGSYTPFIQMLGDGQTATLNAGQRAFAYPAPAGFKCLNTANLPQPTIPDGKDYFNTVTYTGTGATTRSITGTGFQPDLIWLKARSATTNHRWYDSVRGVNAVVSSNTTDAEATPGGTGGVIEFNSNGFTLGSAGADNASGVNFVGWQWNAGGSTVTNTVGNITSQVRANPTAGFSIVTYTGNGSGALTGIGHGLGLAPKFYIIKNRGGATNWFVYHTSLGNTGLSLNTTGTAFANDSYFSSHPNSSRIFVSTNSMVNTNGNGYVAYVWSEIPGFSKFGSYTGNGNADGPFVHTEFRPRFILIRSTSNLRDWLLYDTSTSNPRNPATDGPLPPNVTDITSYDSTAYTSFDILSNGFKIKALTTNLNASGEIHIYMAFAEHPFKTSRAR